jgi:hypothetical protein
VKNSSPVTSSLAQYHAPANGLNLAATALGAGGFVPHAHYHDHEAELIAVEAASRLVSRSWLTSRRALHGNASGG